MAENDKSQSAQIEEEMLKIWADEKTFQKSLELRRGNELYSFYDGPPFANGQPHFGHSLVSSIKDSLGRYKTMRGYYVERRNGWDCHGLPVEFAIEKQLGISGKKQILELGLNKFNAACRDSVFAYKGEWEGFFERIGRWTDTEHAYATIDSSYTESVWWTLSEINKKGLLYKGYKSMPYCPRCETPLSNFEVNEGYKDNVPDPSLYVKFKLADENAYLLGWTTTPWSLPGNAAIAVNPTEQYVYVQHTDESGQDEVLILAKKRLEVLGERDYTVIRELSGKDLMGRSYEPLFSLDGLSAYAGHENLYKIWAASFVSVEDGSGVLHVAPAFGEDDLTLGQENDLPVLSTVDNSGHIQSGIGLDEIKGMFFKKSDRHIIEYLAKKNLVFAVETFEHTYPFCYRCETPLLYYAISTWFIRVSSINNQLLATAEDINWVPEHIKDGRFGKWLEGARDWAISRNRYWGAPMPIWVNEEDENDYIVVSSTTELKEMAGENINLDDLHRPFIDEVVIKRDGKTYQRIEEVIDCWFESGTMPVAQQHYPFENKEKFEKSFPADYIGEALDQTRLWFYVLHVISTVLFGKPAYRNVLVNGIIMASDGQKLSKRLKNYPPVEDVFANEGADSLRLYLLSNYQAVSADYMRFNRDAMKDLNRNVLATLQNTYRFFKMYADIDKWQPATELKEPPSDHILDKWLIARLNETTQEVTKQAEKYNLAHAIQPIFSMIEDTSNWYVRRSRRRFWKSENDNDKQQAYSVLHFTLVRICQLLAPWGPFLSDKIYRELVQGTTMPNSVHLSDWPDAGEADQKVIEEMTRVREYINQGLAQRAIAGIKVRQPLSVVKIPEVSEGFLDIIKEELNVKRIELFDKTDENNNNIVILTTDITTELKREGLMREIVRQVQNARKKADLQVDDRILLTLASQNQELEQAIQQFKDIISHETLATSINGDNKGDYTSKVVIEGNDMEITISKAG